MNIKSSDNININMDEVEDQQQFALYFDDESSKYNYNQCNDFKYPGDSLMDVLLIDSYKQECGDVCCNQNLSSKQKQRQEGKQISHHIHHLIQQQSITITKNPIAATRKRSRPVEKSVNQTFYTKTYLNSQTTNTPQTDPTYISIQDKPTTTNRRQSKSKNQHIYAKNYREKKKEQFKVLEEENAYLKKKITELQSRIRELQHQLTKIKFAPKTVTPLDQANRTLSKGGLKYSENFYQSRNSKISPDKTNEQDMYLLNLPQKKKINQMLQKYPLLNEQSLYKQYAAQYDTYGFAGRLKIQKLQYHMNQFMQNVLKDSQKYLALIAINDRGLLGESLDEDYPQSNYTMFQLMQYDSHKLQTVKKLLKPVMKPAMEKLLHACQKLHIYFQNVFNQMHHAHQFFKQSLEADFLTVKERLQMENYFQCNRYSKQLRRLRDDWILAVRDQKKQQLNYQQKKKKFNR